MSACFVSLATYHSYPFLPILPPLPGTDRRLVLAGQLPPDLWTLRIATTSSGVSSPRPTRTSVPTMFRTIRYRKGIGRNLKEQKPALYIARILDRPLWLAHHVANGAFTLGRLCQTRRSRDCLQVPGSPSPWPPRQEVAATWYALRAHKGERIGLVKNSVPILTPPRIKAWVKGSICRCQMAYSNVRGKTAFSARCNPASVCRQETSKAITCPLAWTPASVRPAPRTRTCFWVIRSMAFSSSPWTVRPRA